MHWLNVSCCEDKIPHPVTFYVVSSGNLRHSIESMTVDFFPMDVRWLLHTDLKNNTFIQVSGFLSSICLNGIVYCGLNGSRLFENVGTIRYNVVINTSISNVAIRNLFDFEICFPI